MPNRILYCVLDWGLGHASRSVPIIRELLESGESVVVASNGASLLLLKKEFPTLSTRELPGYNITYRHESISLNLLGQSLKLLRAIKKENKKVAELVDNLSITQIISDNRFGCYHSDCKNIFITHQIRLLHPKRFVQAAATRLNKRLINKFDECWIPDTSDSPNLSGRMSHDVTLEIPMKYIGPKSRFSPIPLPERAYYNACAIISGPEPQRTYFEEIVVSKLKEVKGRHIIIRGIESEPRTDSQIEFLGILNVQELCKVIGKSEHLISRSGYSSLMDYHSMKRKAILIPTPGQTEQEYLARKQLQIGHHLVLSQNKCDLDKLL